MYLLPNYENVKTISVVVFKLPEEQKSRVRWIKINQPCSRGGQASILPCAFRSAVSHGFTLPAYAIKLESHQV
jgi:hypothetical protein